MALYTLAFTEGVPVLGMPSARLIFNLSTPFWIYKQLMNLVQMCAATPSLPPPAGSHHQHPSPSHRYVACEALVEYDIAKLTKRRRA